VAKWALLAIITVATANDLPASAQPSIWAVSERHELVQLLVATEVPTDHLEQVRVGVRAFNVFAQEPLGRPLRKPVRFHVFPNAESRLPLMRQFLGADGDRLRVILGLDILGNRKGCIDCSQPDATIWLRLDEPCMSVPPVGGCPISYVAAHALTHMWQFEQESFRREPQWWQEGVADYIGYRVADRAGIVAWEHSLWRMRRRVANSPVPIPRTLREFGLSYDSSARSFHQWNSRADGAGYSLFALLTYRLTEERGVPSLAAYYHAIQRGQAWLTAFEVAFGLPVEDAYQRLRQWLGL